jgi:hypothetical protein
LTTKAVKLVAAGFNSGAIEVKYSL